MLKEEGTCRSFALQAHGKSGKRVPLAQKNEVPMLPNDQAPTQRRPSPPQGARFSWWSWRPRLKPQYALALGGILAFNGLILSCAGLFLLFFCIWDDLSPLQTAPVTILSHHPGHPPSLSLASPDLAPSSLAEILVPQSAYDALKDGSSVNLIYTQHLQVPLSLQSTQYTYPLTETSILESPFNALVLLLPGLLLFSYPALLTRWAWRDLFIERFLPKDILSLHAEVVGKRTLTPGLQQQRRARLLNGQAWYGVALRPAQPIGKQTILIFQIDGTHFSTLQEGDWLFLRYSPHLHYVYSLTASSSI